MSLFEFCASLGLRFFRKKNLFRWICFFCVRTLNTTPKKLVLIDVSS